jgi:hypothetical protein
MRHGIYCKEAYNTLTLTFHNFLDNVYRRCGGAEPLTQQRALAAQRLSENGTAQPDTLTSLLFRALLTKIALFPSVSAAVICLPDTSRRSAKRDLGSTPREKATNPLFKALLTTFASGSCVFAAMPRLPATPRCAAQPLSGNETSQPVTATDPLLKRGDSHRFEAIVKVQCVFRSKNVRRRCGDESPLSQLQSLRQRRMDASRI